MYEYATIRSIVTFGNQNLDNESELLSKLYYTYGIIYDYSSPRPTKSGGVSFTVSVIDESCLYKNQYDTKVEIVLPVLMFLNIKSDPSSSSPTTSLPPTPKYIGQIIRLHRLRLESFNHTLQGKGPYYGTSKQHGKPFDYVILENSLVEEETEEEEEAEVEHYFEHKTFTEYDRKRIRELTKFAKQFVQHESASLLRGDYFYKFDQVQSTSEKFDVICKLLSYQAYDGENKYILELFDGTALHVPHQDNVYIVLFTIQQTYLIEVLKKIEKGSYLRLRNIKALSDMRMVSDDKSSIIVLPKEHINTLWIDLMYKQIIGKAGTNVASLKQKLQLPASSSVMEDRSSVVSLPEYRFISTKTLFEHVHEYTSLSQLKQQKEHPIKFKVRVRFVDYEPKNVLDSLYALCPHCQKRVALQDETDQICDHCSKSYQIPNYRWVFQFMIQDTHRETLPVYVSNNDFFHQVVPTSPSNVMNWELLKQQLRMLVSNSNPPVDLCLFSYLNSNSQVSYQIFGTFLNPAK